MLAAPSCTVHTTLVRMHFVSTISITSPFAAPIPSFTAAHQACYASLCCVCLPLLPHLSTIPPLISLCYTDPRWVYLSPFPTTPSVLHLFGSNSWGRKATYWSWGTWQGIIPGEWYVSEWNWMGDKTVFHIHNFGMHDAYSESTAGGLSAVCLFLATARDRKRVYTHGIGTHKDIIAGMLYRLMITYRPLCIDHFS